MKDDAFIPWNFGEVGERDFEREQGRDEAAEKERGNMCHSKLGVLISAIHFDPMVEIEASHLSQ